MVNDRSERTAPTMSQPLQNLPLERINGTRPLSSSTPVDGPRSPSKCDDKKNRPASPFSLASSPTRSQKANLFADYSPQRHSTTASTLFGGASIKESGFSVPFSPGLGEIHALKSLSSHTRTSSDVQGLVKRFEHLDVRDRDAEIQERRKKLEAETRRAVIAREEAEADAKKHREESRRLKKEVEEGKDRERKVGKRLEVVMEEYASFKESHASQSGIYEKEVRKARKEAFKSSSLVVKLQEELKSARNTLRVTQSSLEMERRKIQQRDQETFSAQYKLVSVQEELEKLQARLQVVEQERDALKTSLKEEEVARIAAEGRIAFPTSAADDDDILLHSPTKRSPSKLIRSPLADDEDKENLGVASKKSLDMKLLLQDLSRERVLRERAEEMAEFLRLECRFRCCSCRQAEHAQEAEGSESFIEDLAVIRQDADDVLVPVRESPEVEMADVEEPDHLVEKVESVPVEMEVEVTILQKEDVDLSHTMQNDTASEERTLFKEEVPSPRLIKQELSTEEPQRRAPSLAPPSKTEEPPQTPPTRFAESTTTTRIPLQSSSPDASAHSSQSTPYRQPSSIRTVTTTVMIPMQFTPAKSASGPSNHSSRQNSLGPSRSDSAIASSPIDAENLPPTTLSSSHEHVAPVVIDREAALAAIAYRRGRAKSIADGQATPRKQMLEGIVGGMKERRDVSAPLLGQKTVGGGGSASVHRTAGARTGSASVPRARAISRTR